jgi:hypothetical protein
MPKQLGRVFCFLLTIVSSLNNQLGPFFYLKSISNLLFCLSYPFGIVKFLDFGFWVLFLCISKLFEIKLNEKN